MVMLVPAAAMTSRRPSGTMRLGQANCCGDSCLQGIPRSSWGASQTGSCWRCRSWTVAARRSRSHRRRQSHSHGLPSTRSRLRTTGAGRCVTVAGLSRDKLLPARLRSARCWQPSNARWSTSTSRHDVRSIDSISGRSANEYAPTWTIGLPRKLMMRSADRWRNDHTGTDFRRLFARSSIYHQTTSIIHPTVGMYRSTGHHRHFGLGQSGSFSTILSGYCVLK